MGEVGLKRSGIRGTATSAAIPAALLLFKSRAYVQGWGGVGVGEERGRRGREVDVTLCQSNRTHT